MQHTQKKHSNCIDQRKQLYFGHSNKNDYDTPIPFPPIIWKLNTKRHFGSNLDIARHTEILWQDKIPKAIWRGGLNGGKKIVKNGTLDAEESCKMMDRCKFVMQSIDSETIDVGFASQKKSKKK